MIHSRWNRNATLLGLTLLASATSGGTAPLDAWDPRQVAGRVWELLGVAVNPGQGAAVLVVADSDLAARTVDESGDVEALRLLGSLGYSGSSNFGDFAALGRGRFAASWSYDHHYAGYQGSSLRSFGARGVDTERPMPQAPLLAGDGEGGVFAGIPARWPRPWLLRHLDRRGRQVSEVRSSALASAIEVVGFHGGLLAMGSQELSWIDAAGRVLERIDVRSDPAPRLTANGQRLAWARPTEAGGLAVRAGASPRALGPEFELAPTLEQPADFAVALDAAGRGLVVWRTAAGMAARRFEADGTPRGAIVPLEPDDGLPVLGFALAGGRDDEFVLAWQNRRGVWTRRLPRAVPGDEPCAFDGRRLACDAAHDGGAEDDARDSTRRRAIDEPLLADFDGDGRDDLCGVEPNTAGLVECESSSAPFTRQRFDLRALRAPGDVVRSADLDGVGRDAFCLVRGDLLLCDTGRDGGLAEVVLRLDRVGIVLLGDVDGDGDDDPCVDDGADLRCDTDHDGFTRELKLPSAWVGGNATRVLTATQASERAHLCAWTSGAANQWIWRCDRDRDGIVDVDLSFEPTLDGPGRLVIGNPDGW